MKKKAVAYVIATAVTLIAFLMIYPRLTLKRFAPDESVYHCEQDGVEYYVWFENGRFVTVSADEDRCFVNKVVFMAEGKYWNRLFGKLFFEKGSWTSLKKLPDGARPATVVLTCENSRGVLFDDDGCVECFEFTEGIGGSSVCGFRFYEGRLDADGMMLEKVEGLDPELKELLEKYADPYMD